MAVCLTQTTSSLASEKFRFTRLVAGNINKLVGGGGKGGCLLVNAAIYVALQ
jgi:hypothetical protein